MRGTSLRLRAEPTTQQARAADGFIIAAICVLTLYAGSRLFIPLAIAMLLGFALTPGLLWLRRRGIPKSLATAMVLSLFFAIVISIGTIIASQTSSLFANLPTYERTLRDKISSVRALGVGTGTMDRASEALKNLQKEIEQKKPPTDLSPATPLTNGETGLGAASPTSPIPVEIRHAPKTPVEQLVVALEVIVAPFATFAIVLLFLVFILIDRESLRDRLIRLLGRDDVERSTTALNETARSLSKYLSTLTLLNMAFGAFIGIALWIIGVPNAALWGLVAAIMRFVPFIGSYIAAAFPVLLAAAVDPGWTMFAMTVGLFLILEPLMGHVIEPIIQGRATGLSTIAILIATAFWTLLWGPIGLLLAVPLTLVLVSFGKHIAPLAIFSYLLGEQGSLSQPEKFYQRVLTGDSDEVVEQSKETIEEVGLVGYYDTVVRTALTYAARDSDRNRFDDVRLAEINAQVQDVVELLEEDENDDIVIGPKQPVVICIGAKTEIDDSGSHILASLLNQKGIAAAVIAPRAWAELTATTPAVICVGGFSGLHRIARSARTAHRLRPGSKVISCQWDNVVRDDEEDVEEVKDAVKPTALVTSFEAAIAAVHEALKEKPVADAA